jgi:hypothetical protein
MGGIGVLGFELRHPGLRLVASCNRFDTGDETAFFDDQYVVGRAGKRKRHRPRIPQALWHHAVPKAVKVTLRYDPTLNLIRQRSFSLASVPIGASGHHFSVASTS